jgi:hypothetical protein
MSDTEEKMEFSIPEDDAPENEVVIVDKNEKNEKDDAIDPEDGINDLKMKLQSEQQRRLEAENRAREAIQRQYAAQTEREEANYTLIESAIKTVERDSSDLRAAYRDALSVGDYDRVAEIQDAMTENKLRLSELNRGKEYLKSRSPEAPPPPPPQDPVEALAAQLSPKSAEWIRAHPEYAKDQKLFRKMLAAHELALADGIEPDTDDYFSSVESTLRIERRKPSREPVEAETDAEAMSTAAKPVQRRSAPPAAPVSRATNGPGSTRSNVITLTRAEAEAARDMGMTEKEYWENKRLLQKEGRI